MIGCFVAGTLIHTKEGLRPIEQIKVGDDVLSTPEDGSGGTAYKKVINTFEFEDQETWFISWEDLTMLKAHTKHEIGRDEYLKAYGNGFVITTPNHLFWVVSSREKSIECNKLGRRILKLLPPYPQQQWVRADQLCDGMSLLLADGRIVEVSRVSRVYKTDTEWLGWIRQNYDDATSKGIMLNFSNANVVPNVHIYAHRFDSPYCDPEYGLLENPNKSYLYDYPYDEEVPESWYRSKVYHFEVEDYHTYFVDTMGVWVHSNNECMTDREFNDARRKSV
ncbi:polymorphic toxin-type HINT domain-containing protein [Stenoxybacter acetivorans]|uniref:polymorphic toxin-type HINT domain-containing protein n=1 Tax=Stenoxybacter acetivorans TaxID=422441 RepID=UPI00055D90D9|nr:polymorphic toxin-type HINT domain-containing protein [Stenoxybacter acetivorans]